MKPLRMATHQGLHALYLVSAYLVPGHPPPGPLSLAPVSEAGLSGPDLLPIHPALSLGGLSNAQALMSTQTPAPALPQVPTCGTHCLPDLLPGCLARQDRSPKLGSYLYTDLGISPTSETKHILPGAGEQTPLQLASPILSHPHPLPCCSEIHRKPFSLQWEP
jgi:hypothetical protein